MKTDIFFYTGTGNSLWTARILAKEMSDAEIIPISSTTGDSVASGADAIGIIFPVHIWGLPRRIISFVNALDKYGPQYYFAVAVNAGQVAATLIQLKKQMHTKGLSLSSGFELVMPSNYIPWGGPGPEEEQIRQFEAARNKIGRIASVCTARRKQPVEKGPLWQNIFFTWLNRLSFSHIPTMDRSFWVDDKCNSCGICMEICPSDNINLSGNRPTWLHNCEQCLACIQWCPQEAIQFGKKTPRYKRYHHPEITLRDMLAIRPTRYQ